MYHSGVRAVHLRDESDARALYSLGSAHSIQYACGMLCRRDTNQGHAVAHTTRAYLSTVHASLRVLSPTESCHQCVRNART